MSQQQAIDWMQSITIIALAGSTIYKGRTINRMIRVIGAMKRRIQDLEDQGDE